MTAVTPQTWEAALPRVSAYQMSDADSPGIVEWVIAAGGNAYLWDQDPVERVIFVESVYGLATASGADDGSNVGADWVFLDEDANWQTLNDDDFVASYPTFIP